MGEDPREQQSLELPSLFKRRPRSKVETAPEPESGPEPEPEPEPERPSRNVSVPEIGPLPAALVTGAFVGLVTAGLVWSALRGCAGLRGTSSCGDPGLLVLVAIFVATVLLGRLVLGLLRVPHAASTALLAVALVAVVEMAFPDELTGVTGAVALAVLGAVAFAAAQRLTAANSAPGDRPR